VIAVMARKGRERIRARKCLRDRMGGGEKEKG